MFACNAQCDSSLLFLSIRVGMSTMIAIIIVHLPSIYPNGYLSGNCQMGKVGVNRHIITQNFHALNSYQINPVPSEG